MKKRILVSVLIFLLSFLIVYLSVVFITFDFNIENLKGEDRAFMLFFTVIIAISAILSFNIIDISNEATRK